MNFPSCVARRDPIVISQRKGCTDDGNPTVMVHNNNGESRVKKDEFDLTEAYAMRASKSDGAATRWDVPTAEGTPARAPKWFWSRQILERRGYIGA
jgi:hypothetical protein